MKKGKYKVHQIVKQDNLFALIVTEKDYMKKINTLEQNFDEDFIKNNFPFYYEKIHSIIYYYNTNAPEVISTLCVTKADILEGFIDLENPLRVSDFEGFIKFVDKID